MLRKDFLLVGGWMLATVGILAAVTPEPLSATDAELARLTPAVQQPKISAKGYTLAVEWVRPASGEQIAADTRPVIRIIASSNSPEIATLRVQADADVATAGEPHGAHHCDATGDLAVRRMRYRWHRQRRNG